MSPKSGQGRTVLVTGASGGIGAATVSRLAGDGWNVVAAVRDLAAGDALAPRAGGAVVPLQLDVVSDESVGGLASRVREHLADGRLAGLVNNAGILVEGPVELLTTAELRRQFEVNVIGAMAVTRELLPLLRESGGRIVNVGAVTGRTPIPYLGASGASKAALLAFNDVLRVEVGRFGVQVSIVEPTPVETPIFEAGAAAADAARAGLDAQITRLYEPGIAAIRRVAEKDGGVPPDDVAKAIQRALTARRPRTRYPVGRRPRVIMGLRFVPDRVRDALLAREIGLRKLPAGTDA